jgi:hypothetical protein
MKAHLVCTLALLLAVVFTLRAQTSVPAPAPLAMSASPQLAAEPIQIRIIGTSDEGAAAVYLHNLRATEIRYGRLIAHLEDKEGKVLNGVEVTLMDDKVNLLKDLHIEGTSKVQPAVLSVKKLADLGEFQGKLWAVDAGQLIKIADFKVIRLPAPGIVWTEAASNAIKISHAPQSFVHTFVVRSLNRTPADHVWVELPALIGPDDESIASKWKVAGKVFTAPARTEFPLPGFDSMALVLEADLSKPGDYRAELGATVEETRVSAALTINRTVSETPPVEIFGLGNVRLTQGLRAPDSKKLWVKLLNTSDRGVRISSLGLVSLVRKIGADTAVAEASSNGLSDPKDGSTVALPVEIAQGAERVLHLELPHLSKPGEYAAVVKLVAADAKPVTTQFSIFLRQGPWPAGIAIFLGALLSTAIRYYKKSYRPLLELRKSARELITDAARLRAAPPALDDEEKRILAALDDRLRTLDRKLKNRETTGADGALTELNHKLSIFPRWREARRTVLALPDASVREQYWPTVKAAAEYLERTSETPEEFKLQQDALTKLGGQIDGTLRTTLRTSLDALIAQAEVKYRVMPLDRRADLDRWLREARDGLPIDLSAQRERLAALRKGYLQVLVADLGATLSTQEPLPGFSDPDWSSLSTGVNQLLEKARDAASDAEAVGASYSAAVDHYLDAAIRKLGAEAARAEGRVAADTSATDAQKKLWTDALKTAKEKLDTARSHLQSGREREAAEADFHAALAAFLQLPGAVRGAPAAAAAMMMRRADDIERELPTRLVASLPRGFHGTVLDAIAGRAPRQLPRVGEWAKAIAFYDSCVWIVLILASVLIGLKVLWVDDATWGGIAAYITAFLWGLGLHQVTAASFESPEKLGEKFST